jgi:hypothetical protein
MMGKESEQLMGTGPKEMTDGDAGNRDVCGEKVEADKLIAVLCTWRHGKEAAG